MSMSTYEWLSVIKNEYLKDYVRHGGSSVKFAVADEGSEFSDISDDLGSMAKEEGFVVVHVDSRKTKVHLIDLLFFEIARQIDWDDLGYQFLSRLLTEHGCKTPEAKTEFNWSGNRGVPERERGSGTSTRREFMA